MGEKLVKFALYNGSNEFLDKISSIKDFEEKVKKIHPELNWDTVQSEYVQSGPLKGWERFEMFDNGSGVLIGFFGDPNKVEGFIRTSFSEWEKNQDVEMDEA